MYSKGGMLFCMDAVIIRVIDLPYKVRAVTVKDAEGDYNIYLNARLSGDQQAKAFRHEATHIRLGHFYSEKPVFVKEAETKNYEP